MNMFGSNYSQQLTGTSHDERATVMDIDAFLQVSTPPNIISIVPSSSTTADQQCSFQGISVVKLDPGAVSEEEINCVDENSNPNSAEKRTHEEVTLLKGSKKHAASEMKFNSFKINWKKISDGTLDRLQKMQNFRNMNSTLPVPRSLQISKTDLSGLANSVVDQLRCIDNIIRADVMEKAAREIFNMFPCLNFVDDDGFGKETDYVWLKHKMINHNTYLNRYKEPNQPKASSSDIRRYRNLRAGTIKEYWQKSSQDCPKNVLSALSRNEPELLTRDFLQTSQSYVRYCLDENIPLKDVLAKHSVLRRRSLLNYHFECATGVKAESLEQYFSAKRSKIIDFSKSNRKFLLLDAHSSDYDIFKFLCRSLGENIDDVIILKEMGTKIDSITTDCSGPVLVAIDCGNNRQMYYVFAEQIRLSEGTESVVQSITDLMCVHYVHNFMYMKQASKFMEFIQEYLFKILPTTGSKSNATRKGQQQRVVKRFIEALSNHIPNS
ncbi:uncharacterized protein LOC131687191 [Topomyia yanbarensis]|uniref:uncharacterized protein LOC131687191 n=1 Tax=Topomyia yanbarensis TaxID=2498891 RepID=UPI00273A7B55|nr:uncharacterized protein LOC131687191 [Topomyia yanbarensis]